MENITLDEGYLAMFIFLHDLQKRTNSDDLAEFLGSMSILADGNTADPAMKQDWVEAVEKARDSENWGVARFELK